MISKKYSGHARHKMKWQSQAHFDCSRGGLSQSTMVQWDVKNEKFSQPSLKDFLMDIQ